MTRKRHEKPVPSDIGGVTPEQSGVPGPQGQGEQCKANPDAVGPKYDFDIRFSWTPEGEKIDPPEVDSVGGRGTVVSIAKELRRILEGFEPVHGITSDEIARAAQAPAADTGAEPDPAAQAQADGGAQTGDGPAPAAAHHCGPCETSWNDVGGCPNCGCWSTEDLRTEVVDLTEKNDRLSASLRAAEQERDQQRDRAMQTEAQADASERAATQFYVGGQRYQTERDEARAQVERLTTDLAGARQRAAGRLREAAAGRLEYTEGLKGSDNPSLVEQRETLEFQAAMLERAARVVEGDDEPLFNWLPSWRWSQEMWDSIKPKPAPDRNGDLLTPGVEGRKFDITLDGMHWESCPIPPTHDEPAEWAVIGWDVEEGCEFIDRTPGSREEAQEQIRWFCSDRRHRDCRIVCRTVGDWVTAEVPTDGE